MVGSSSSSSSFSSPLEENSDSLMSSSVAVGTSSLSSSSSSSSSSSTISGNNRRSSSNRAAYFFAVASMILIVGLLGPGGLILFLHEEPPAVFANNALRSDSMGHSLHDHRNGSGDMDQSTSHSLGKIETLQEEEEETSTESFSDPLLKYGVKDRRAISLDSQPNDAPTKHEENNKNNNFSSQSRGNSNHPMDAARPSKRPVSAKEEFNPLKLGSKKNKPNKRKKKKKKANTPFPVYAYNDDSMKFEDPIASTPADALECRSSVKEFIINATDVKDECYGLRKAFDTTCGGTVAEVDDQHQHQHQQQQQQQHQQQRRRRRLMGEWHDDDLSTSYTTMPQEKWIEWTARNFRILGRRWFGKRPNMEDEILGYAWRKAMYMVQNNFDRTEEYQQHNKWIFTETNHLSIEKKRRRLDEPKATEEHHDPDNEPENVPSEQTTKDQTLEGTKQDDTNDNTAKTKNDPAPREPKKLMLSPKLPTANLHVGDQMLNDAVLLSDGGGGSGKNILLVANRTNGTSSSAEAVDGIPKGADSTANNNNNNNDNNNTISKEKAEAVLDAEASSAAIKKASEVVSAVLSDPDSVEARTCCASILNVFHEHCDEPEGEQMSDSRLFTVVFVIAFCGMVKSLIRHHKIRWLPEAGGCILVGVLASMCLQFIPHSDFGFDENMFLRLMVPPIVFEAALNIDKRSFRRHLIPIIIFAVLGTLLSTVLTAYIVNKMTEMMGNLCTSIPFVPALIFGALISSIDPIAVLSVLNNLGMTDTDTIYVLIFGESLLNDGVAIVLFQTLVHFLDDSLAIDAAAISAAAFHFLVVAFGSLAVGLLSGFCCTAYYWLMHGCHTPLVEVLMFLCWAFLPYYICDGVEWSGIVSIVAAGFVMDLYVIGQKKRDHYSSSLHGDEDLIQENHNGESSSSLSHPMSKRRFFEKQGHLSDKARSHIHFVTEINSTLMETAIFAYLGLFLFSSRYHWNIWLAFTSIFACIISRAVMISSLTIVANWLTNLNRAAILSPLSKLSRKRQESKETNTTFTNGDISSLPSTSPQNSSSAKQQQQQQQQKPTPIHHHDREQQQQQQLVGGVKIDSRMQIVLLFAGLRGAMSFALVENIPLYDTVTGRGLRLKPELKAMTSASILFTVFVLGGYTFYLMERLGVSSSSFSHGGKGGDDDDEDVEKTSLVQNVGKVEILSPVVQQNNGPEAARKRRTRKSPSNQDSFSSYQ